MIRIGVAGWSIPRHQAHRFPTDGTHLERFSRVFSCVEINSSFYRHHSAATYGRWASSTPPRFQFAVKLPRTITHELRLIGARQPLAQFLEETAGLGGKRGPVLVQLPPSSWFDARVAGRFFGMFRDRYDGPIVCEPRHATWFTTSARRLLVEHHIARVAADPVCAPGANEPGGWKGLAYFRLHGSPRMYWSIYDEAFIKGLAKAIRMIARTADVWCVFDNTALGAAIDNAVELRGRIKPAQLAPAERP